MTAPADAWPGQGLGLPESGRGSLAAPGRRVAALTVDWLACSLVSFAFFDYNPVVTLGIFVLEQVLLIATLGGSFGHVLLGMRVHRTVDGATPPAPLAALVRAVLVGLFVPALLPGGDGRQLHDKAAGTLLLRR
ncbi:RDD family protein [Quadrisphaera granulorum]|uniref:RDD family protein n=1 Tax=Quadrisphaera granulorum TaxID=317664 RepID=UPI000D6D17CD|nr:RDD family protein [Quadrisphaera granulorum]